MPVESADCTQGKTIIDSQPGYLTYHPSPALNAAAPFQDLLAHLAPASCITPLALIAGQHSAIIAILSFLQIGENHLTRLANLRFQVLAIMVKSAFAGSATFGFCHNGSNPQTCLCAVH